MPIEKVMSWILNPGQDSLRCDRWILIDLSANLVSKDTFVREREKERDTVDIIKTKFIKAGWEEIGFLGRRLMIGKKLTEDEPT